MKKRSLVKLAAKHPKRIWARRGENCPPGYTEKYVWRDSDYVSHKTRMFVRKDKGSHK